MVLSLSRTMSEAAAELTYEDALARLEHLVEAMEAGDIPLADLVTRYEESNRLLQLCERRLQEAELRLEKLTREQDAWKRAALETPQTES